MYFYYHKPFPMKLLLFLYLLPLTATAQNLIPNGDFNSINICEVKSPCAPKGWYTSYDIDWAYQRFRRLGRDETMCLFFAIDPRGRSYWQSELVAPLQAGEKYELEYYVRKVDGELAPDVIQFAFTSARTHLLGMARPAGIPPAVLQVKKRKQLREGWERITAVYTATGGEQWIIAGNFMEQAPVSKTFYSIDNLSLQQQKGRQMPEAAYTERLKQLYENNLRHELSPRRMVTLDPSADVSHIKKIEAPIGKTDTLHLTDLLFEVNSHELKDTSILSNMLARIRANTYRRIYVQGHTDSSGNEQNNFKLSVQRAGEVAGYLVRNGVPSGMLTVTGFGSEKPLQQNDTPEHRRMNRRVEVVIVRE